MEHAGFSLGEDALFRPGCCDAAPGHLLGPSSHQASLRLVDLFQENMVKGAPTEVRQTEPLGLWDFTQEAEASAESAPNLGWRAGDGVSGLSLREGGLKGKARTDFPSFMSSGPGGWTRMICSTPWRFQCGPAKGPTFGSVERVPRIRTLTRSSRPPGTCPGRIRLPCWPGRVFRPTPSRSRNRCRPHRCTTF